MLVSEAEVRALESKTEFTQAEWDAFGIKHLEPGNVYVKAGGKMYEPIDSMEPFELGKGKGRGSSGKNLYNTVFVDEGSEFPKEPEQAPYKYHLSQSSHQSLL